MKDRTDFLKGAALAAGVMLLCGATLYTTYRGKFVGTFSGDGAGVTNAALASGSALTNTTVYGNSSRSNWTVMSGGGLLNTNTNGSYFRAALGAVMASASLSIATNGAPPAVAAGYGTLWNSNRVLYWVTATQTNMLSDGF